MKWFEEMKKYIESVLPNEVMELTAYRKSDGSLVIRFKGGDEKAGLWGAM